MCIFYFILIILCKFCFSRNLSISTKMSAIFVVVYYMYYNLFKVSIMIPSLLFLTVVIMFRLSLPYQSNQDFVNFFYLFKEPNVILLNVLLFFSCCLFSIPLTSDIISIISFLTLNLGLLCCAFYDLFMADPQAIDFQTFFLF